MNFSLLKFLDVNRINVFTIYSFVAESLRCFYQINVKRRSIISEFFAKMRINLHNQCHNYRNIRALLVAYYAIFVSTIYQSGLPRVPLTLLYTTFAIKGRTSFLTLN